jgi:hypothetical protein
MRNSSLIKCVLLVFITFCGKPSTAVSTLHFIVFADSDDPSIGESVLKTYVYLTSDLQATLSKYSGLKVVAKSFYGADCNVINLDKTVNELNVSPNDAVFFYFVGHGWNRRLSTYPSMIFGNANADRVNLEQSSRDLEEVYKNLRAKNPRFSLVVADACNGDRMDDPQVTSTRKVLVMKPVTPNPSSLAKLFNNFRGGMIMSSSQRNTFSYSDPKGGWMSLSFQSAMGEMYSTNYTGEVSWPKFAERVKEKTMAEAEKNDVEQEPQFNVKDIYPVTGSAPLISTSRSPSSSEPGKTLSKEPCKSVTNYVNETALSGIREDLPMLIEIYEKIDSDNAVEYAETFSLFYKNQKAFYDNLGQAVFYQVDGVPEHCKPSLQTVTGWVGSNAKEVNQRYAVIQKYAAQPNRLVQQARNDLPTIIQRLEEILVKLDK